MGLIIDLIKLAGSMNNKDDDDFDEDELDEELEDEMEANNLEEWQKE